MYPVSVLVKGDIGLLRRRVETMLAAHGLSLASPNGAPPAARASDVVVLVRDLSGVARLVDLRSAIEESGEAPTLIVSGAADDAAIRRALTAGASGLVLDTEIDTALVAAVRAVAANQTCVPRGVKIAVHKPSLSHREREVLKLAVSGRTNGEIAATLCLAESTVKSHLSAAFNRLGVRSRREAATLVLDPDEGLQAIIFGTSAPNALG